MYCSSVSAAYNQVPNMNHRHLQPVPRPNTGRLMSPPSDFRAPPSPSHCPQISVDQIETMTRATPKNRIRKEKKKGRNPSHDDAVPTSSRCSPPVLPAIAAIRALSSVTSQQFPSPFCFFLHLPSPVVHGWMYSQVRGTRIGTRRTMQPYLQVRENRATAVLYLWNRRQREVVLYTE